MVKRRLSCSSGNLTSVGYILVLFGFTHQFDKDAACSSSTGNLASVNYILVLFGSAAVVCAHLALAELSCSQLS